MAFAPVFRRPFSATFDRRAAAAGNGLLNALIAYWPGNEASGNLLDAHTNALHLTDENTVTNAAGKVYATARKYTAANSEYHVRPGDDALLSAGDVDFTLAAWVYFDTVGTISKWLVSKRTTGAGANGYQLLFFGSDLGGTNRLAFFAFVDGALTEARANTFGGLTAGVWYHIVAWHDATANQIGVEVNGVADTAAHSAGVGDDSGRFAIGILLGALSYYHNGRIGPVAFWKSAAGGGGVLTAAQRTALYNGGTGLAYAQFTA